MDQITSEQFRIAQNSSEKLKVPDQNLKWLKMTQNVSERLIMADNGLEQLRIA